MDFRVSREAFLRVLTHVSSIVDSRSTIPILSNIYLKCENNQIEIRSTDMDISIREFVSCDSTKNGEATVNSRILTDIIRKTKKNSIVKCKLEGNRLIINSDNSVFELNALSADEFPKFVPLDPTNSFELTIPQMKRLFNKTKFAISAEETRYYLNGIYFHTVANGSKTSLRCVATDGHRLAKTELDLHNVLNLASIWPRTNQPLKVWRRFNLFVFRLLIAHFKKYDSCCHVWLRQSELPQIFSNLQCPYYFLRPRL